MLQLMIFMYFPVVFFQFLFLFIIKSYLSKMVCIWTTFTNKLFVQEHPFVISIDCLYYSYKNLHWSFIQHNTTSIFRLRVSSMSGIIVILYFASVSHLVWYYFHIYNLWHNIITHKNTIKIANHTIKLAFHILSGRVSYGW